MFLIFPSAPRCGALLIDFVRTAIFLIIRATGSCPGLGCWAVCPADPSPLSGMMPRNEFPSFSPAAPGHSLGLWLPSIWSSEWLYLWAESCWAHLSENDTANLFSPQHLQRQSTFLNPSWKNILHFKARHLLHITFWTGLWPWGTGTEEKALGKAESGHSASNGAVRNKGRVFSRGFCDRITVSN